MKRAIVFLILLLNINFFISSVSAFGVATLYSDNYPLKMYPGETKETFFLLRNVVEGDDDVVIKSELTSGADIAKLIDGAKSYDAPFGSEIEVPLSIEIPKEAVIGSEYRIGAIFRPTPTKVAGGNIQFIINIGKSFPVVIIEKSKQAKKEIETYTITLEDDGGVGGAFAPFIKGAKGIWLGFIFGLIAGIIIVIMLIISFTIKAVKRTRELAENDFIQAENISRPY